MEIQIRNTVLVASLMLSCAAIHGQEAQPDTESRLHSAAPLAASASTSVPALVPYSGIAVAADGKPLIGEVAVTFLIFKEQLGGQPLWTESQIAALDANGRFSVHLGASLVNGIPLNLFGSGEARWLEVQVAGQPPQPRVLLVSVPYALKAADAATLGGLPASAFALAGANTATNTLLPAGLTPNAGSSAVTTTGGTANKLAKFSGANTIVNSIVYDNGTQVGIGTTTPTATLTVDGTLTVNGNSTYDGQLVLPATGTATASKSFASQFVKLQTSAYNSSSKSVVPPRFQLQAEVTGNNSAAPNATLNLLASATASAPVETGFYLNTNGTVHFAASQTFPGTGTGNGTISRVTAGTGLTGGGTSGNVTLSVNTATIPTLTGNNTYTGSNVFVPSLYEDLDINVDATNANNGGNSPGLRFGSASGEGMASKRTSGGNQYGVDIYTNYAARLSVNAAGQVAIGTGGAFNGAQLEVQNATGDGGDFTGGSSGSGLMGQSSSSYGVFGQTSDTNGTGAGVYGYSSGMISDSGIFAGHTNDPGITGAAAYGDGGDFYGGADGVGGSFQGGTDQNDGNSGVMATGGTVRNVTNGVPGYGIYATGGYDFEGNTATQIEAGEFDGDVFASGYLSPNGSQTKIDHPADPANKYLIHASVQSSEMMNIYSGNVTTDEFGLATVKLPDWFEVENGDFRYQLTVIGGRFAQAIVSKEIANGQFTITTNASNVKVSWLVTGVRQDAYAKSHPLVVEAAKPTRERGFYLNPELYGQPKEKQTEWGRHPEAMRRMQASRNAHKTALNSLYSPAARSQTANANR